MTKRNSILVVFTLLFLIVNVGCGGGNSTNELNTNDSVNSSNDSNNDSSSEGSSLFGYSFNATPIPTVEIIVEPVVGIFEINFYSIGIMENNEMLISLIANGLIPEAEYQAIITGDGVSESYDCMKSPSYNNILTCFGTIIPEAMIVSIQIISPVALTSDLDFSGPQLVSDQLAGGETVDDPWKAWEMVDKCQEAKAKGDNNVDGCDAITLEAYVPQSDCLGLITCSNTCSSDMDISDSNYDIFELYDIASVVNGQSPACQDFVEYMSPSYTLPGSLPYGSVTNFWNSFVNQLFVVVEDENNNPQLSLTNDFSVAQMNPFLFGSIPNDESAEIIQGYLNQFIAFPTAKQEAEALQEVAILLLGENAKENIDVLVEEDDNAELFQLIIGDAFPVTASGFPSPKVNDLPTGNIVVDLLQNLIENAPGLNPDSAELIQDPPEYYGGEDSPEVYSGETEDNQGDFSFEDENTVETYEGETEGIEAPLPPPDIGNLTDDIMNQLNECASDNNRDPLENESEILAFLYELVMNRFIGSQCETEGLLYLEDYFTSMIFDAQACLGQMSGSNNAMNFVYPPYWGRVENMEEWAASQNSYQGELVTDEEKSLIYICNLDGTQELLEIYKDIFYSQYPDDLTACLQSFDPRFKWHEFYYDEDMNNFYLYLKSLQAEGAEIDPSCNSTDVNDYFETFVEENADRHWFIDVYIPSSVQDCAEDLDTAMVSKFVMMGDTTAERFYDFYYQALTDWGVEHDYNWNLFPASCKTAEFFEWLEIMEFGDPNHTAPDNTNCPECSTAYDCTIEPNLFYCSEEIPDDSAYSNVLNNCVADIAWPDPPITYYQASNVVALLTAAAPWMTDFSMPAACEATLLSVSSNHPGTFASFTSNVLDRWGEEGTYVWGKDMPIFNIFGTLKSLTIPDMSIFEVPPTATPMPSNDGGGGGGCVQPPNPDPDNPHFYIWYPDLCAWVWTG